MKRQGPQDVDMEDGGDGALVRPKTLEDRYIEEMKKTQFGKRILFFNVFTMFVEEAVKPLKLRFHSVL